MYSALRYCEHYYPQSNSELNGIKGKIIPEHFAFVWQQVEVNKIVEVLGSHKTKRNVQKFGTNAHCCCREGNLHGETGETIENKTSSQGVLKRAMCH